MLILIHRRFYRTHVLKINSCNITNRKYNETFKCEFGALASVYTTSPSFQKISGLPKWIQEAVHETWANNDYLSRGDVLELYFFSAAPEPAGKGSHEAFHFIKLRRPDTNAQKFIKDPPTDETPLVASISEDDIYLPEELGVYGSVSQRWTKSSFRSNFIIIQ